MAKGNQSLNNVYFFGKEKKHSLVIFLTLTVQTHETV